MSSFSLDPTYQVLSRGGITDAGPLLIEASQEPCVCPEGRRYLVLLLLLLPCVLEPLMFIFVIRAFIWKISEQKVHSL